jgi:hypothetical protein
MNNCPPGPGRGPRLPWPRRARLAAAITVMAAAALLAAACGGSPSSTGSGGSPTAGGSANSSSAVAYSRCVRAHGVPNFPDPGSSGQIPGDAAKGALRGVSDSRAKAATYACAHLNPGNSSGSQPAASAQTIAERLSFSRCMRGRGVPNFPDPNSTGGYDLHGIDPHSPVVKSAALTCLHVLSPTDQQRVRTAVGG